jgi:hypothetical protein
MRGRHPELDRRVRRLSRRIGRQTGGGTRNR